MKPAADPHEEFEIAALRRAHGALDAESATRLDAHLVECAACRGFATTDAAAATALRRRAQAAAANRDWHAIRDASRTRIRRQLGRILLNLALATGVLVLCLPWAQDEHWSGSRNGAMSWAVIMFVCVIVSTITWLVRRRRTGRAESMGAGELLRRHRRELDTEIANLRSRRIWAIAFLALFALNDVFGLVMAATQYPYGFGETVAWSDVLAEILIHVFLVWWFWYRALFVLPRIERERRELGK